MTKRTNPLPEGEGDAGEGAALSGPVTFACPECGAEIPIADHGEVLLEVTTDEAVEAAIADRDAARTERNAAEARVAELEKAAAAAAPEPSAAEVNGVDLREEYVVEDARVVAFGGLIEIAHAGGETGFTDGVGRDALRAIRTVPGTIRVRRNASGPDEIVGVEG